MRKSIAKIFRRKKNRETKFDKVAKSEAFNVEAAVKSADLHQVADGPKRSMSLDGNGKGLSIKDEITSVESTTTKVTSTDNLPQTNQVHPTENDREDANSSSKIYSNGVNSQLSDGKQSSKSTSDSATSGAGDFGDTNDSSEPMDSQAHNNVTGNGNSSGSNNNGGGNGGNGAVQPNASSVVESYDQIPVLEQTKLPRGGVSVETKAVGRVQVRDFFVL